MFKLKSLVDFFFPTLMFGGGDSGGGGTTKTETSNIPEYARPYVETMLGSAQKEMFNYAPGPDGTQTPTGLKPYKPFSTDMNDYVAGFSPMQQQAFQGAAGLQPSQQTADASNIAGYAGLQALGTQYDPMMARADTFGGRQAAQYMSPFVEQAMAPQLREAQRASEIQAQQNAAQAVGKGAFGGSRSALVEAERQRNLATQQGDIRAKGLQAAYEQAQNQFNQDAARRLQAQQMNIGQQQFGANLGMQGLSTALNAANQLGSLGSQQFGQQKDVIGLQQQMGAQQQQLEQQKINQEIQNYANQQQWAMQQLSNMNALLRGLPLQATTTQSYQSSPLASQLAGLGTAAYGASKLAAKGGSTKDIQKRKGDGLMDLAISKMG